MKKIIIAFLAVFVAGSAYCQEFPVSWKSKFSFDPDRWFFDNNIKYVLGRSSSQAEVLDGTTGKMIWTLNFKSDLSIKELNRATYLEDEGLVLFFNPDDKKKTGEKVVVDLPTGKVLWRADQYAGNDADDYFHFAHCFGDLTKKGITVVFDNSLKKFVGLDVRSGAKKWESKAYPEMELSKNVMINSIEDTDYVYVISDLNILYINVNTGEISETSDNISDNSSGTLSRYRANYVVVKYTDGKTSVKLTGEMKQISPEKIKMKLEANGEQNWKIEWEGKAVRQLFNDNPYVKMDVQGGKVFVLSKNITVFDIKTGKQLWEAPFDNCDVSIGLKAKQELGIAGWPLVSGDAVYYVDLKNDNAIKKVDANTGALIWKTESFQSSDRIPNIMEVNGVLLAQFGGMINVQKFMATSDGGEVRKNENKFDGTFGVRAYDVNSGKMIWNTASLADKLGDKFKTRISTIYASGNKLFVASEKNLFCLDPKTADVIYKTSLAESKIGEMFEVRLSDDLNKFYIFCDNGVAAANLADGKLIYATKTDDIFWQLPGSASYSFSQGANFFVWVGEEDFIGFDLASGKVKGKMEDNTNPQMSAAGDYILVRDGSKITKYAVNP